MPLIEENRLFEKINKGELVIGTQIRSRSPLIAEMLGYCDFDFLYIEGEHFAFDNETVENLLRAIEITGVFPIIRTPTRDAAKIMQYLDMGAMGLIFPHVETGKEAREIVKAGKFLPLGARGFSNTSRATKYGKIPMKDYTKMANKNTMLIAMIESKKAVENIEDILTSGIDAIRVGSYDLSYSYGFGGEQDHKKLQETHEYIVKCANKTGIPVGTGGANPEEVIKKFEMGFNMICLGSDMMLLKANVNTVVKNIRIKLNK